jgi:hypothetical protein
MTTNLRQASKLLVIKDYIIWEKGQFLETKVLKVGFEKLFLLSQKESSVS